MNARSERRLPVAGVLLLATGLFTLASTAAVPAATAQGGASLAPPGRVVVQNGTMYWETGEQVALFGVNYQPAFAHSHRALRLLGKDHRRSIEEDTYHFARMGFDAYRIHMWDREVTDSLGNLLENEHLDLHDYTIHRMAERGIRTIITPLTYYTNAYPDGATPAPGFANYISKGGAPQNPEFLPVLKNYLSQLIHHRNPYNGMTAVENPNIIALEIDNEPSHSGYERTLNFVNALADHLRADGWTKPIFYNITHGVPDAYLDARIDGVTFQWYPAGLVGGRTIRKNYFPYVNSYPIVWAEDERFDRLAQLVYEFDAADVINNYALPMMARSFRAAGMQWATQFAYDPLGIGHLNSDYQTHYLNFAYTPNKAISALIAGEVFRRVGLREQFADFPADTAFGDFLMSHHRDLSQLNAEDSFLYSNHTETTPRNESALRRIAGAGSSPAVSYPGTGAYFLDRVGDGVWRLEVMPDAVPVRDPFERPAFDKYNVHIEWREHPIRIRLEDLGDRYAVRGLNEGNTFTGTAAEGSFTVSPGVYLLTRNGVSGDRWNAASRLGAIALGEYHAVPPTAGSPVVFHTPLERIEAGRPVSFVASIAGLREGDTVLLQVNPSTGQARRLEMVEVAPHRYSAELPADQVPVGMLRYWIVIERDGAFTTFPGGNPSAPWAWNFYHAEEWFLDAVPSGAPIELWNAARDHRRTAQGFGGFGGGGNESELIASDRPGQLVRRVSSASPTDHRHVLGLSAYIADRMKGISPATLRGYTHVVVRGRTALNHPADMKIVLVDDDANAFSAAVPLDGTLREHRIPIASFLPDRFMLLPRSYPPMMVSWFETGVPGPVRPDRIEEIQFLIDTAGATGSEGNRYGFEIEAAWLE
jgi:hypothetical protein